MITKMFPENKENIDEALNQPSEDLSAAIRRVFPAFSGRWKEKKYKDWLDTMMMTLKNNRDFLDLAMYYQALESVNNIFSDSDTNMRNGRNMLQRLVKLENIYAKRYLQYNPDPVDGEP